MSSNSFIYDINVVYPPNLGGYPKHFGYISLCLKHSYHSSLCLIMHYCLNVKIHSLYNYCQTKMFVKATNCLTKDIYEIEYYHTHPTGIYKYRLICCYRRIGKQYLHHYSIWPSWIPNKENLSFAYHFPNKLLRFSQYQAQNLEI